MKRILLLVAILLAAPVVARAQGVTPIRALDTSTTAPTDVGDITNHAIRVNLVASAPTIAISGTVAVSNLPTGTAGSPSSSVLTVQGIASMTALKVDGSAVTQPVSGTVTADTELPSAAALANATANPTAPAVGAFNLIYNGTTWDRWTGAVTQSAGPWTENQTQIAGTAVDVNSGNKSAGTQRVVLATDQPALTNALKVDGSAVTQPVSGSVTANLGTLNGAALDASVTALEVSQGSTTSGQKGALLQGAVTTSAPTYTTAQTSPLSLDTAGNLRVAVTGGGSNAAASATGSAVPSSAGYTGVNVGGTLRGLTGLSVGSQFPATVAIVDGSGTQITSFGGAGGTASNYGSAFPASGTAAGFSDGTNMQGARVVDLDTGAGTVYGLIGNLVRRASGGPVELIGSSTSANSLPVVIASDQGAVPVSGTVTSNIGTTNGLALDASVTGLQVAQGSTTSGEKGGLLLGAVTTNAPTYTTAQSSPLSLDTAGLARVSLKDTPSNTNNLNVNLAASAATVTVSGTVTTTPPSNASTNVAQIGATNVVTGGASGLLAVAGPVASGGANADNPIKDGLVFNTTQPTVTNGQIVDAQATARGAQIVATGVDTFTSTVVQPTGANLHAVLDTTSTTAVTQPTGANLHTVLDSGTLTTLTTLTGITNALPPGSNVIGHVIADSGSTTAVTGTVASNVTQFGSSNVVTGTGASGAGIPRVTLANDSSLAANQSVNLTQVGNSTIALGKTLAVNSIPVVHSSDDPVLYALSQISNALRVSTTGKAGFLGTFGRPVTSTGDALDVNLKYPLPSFDPCLGNTKDSIAISQTASAKLLSGIGRRYVVCQIKVVGADAENVSLVEGTGATCGTGTLAIDGATTAANGPNFLAGGGSVDGTGGAGILYQHTAGNDVCLLQSGSGRVAGHLTYALLPQ